MKATYKFLLEIELDGPEGWEEKAPDPEFLRRESEAAVERWIECADDPELESSNWVGVKLTDVAPRGGIVGWIMRKLVKGD